MSLYPSRSTRQEPKKWSNFRNRLINLCLLADQQEKERDGTSGESRRERSRHLTPHISVCSQIIRQVNRPPFIPDLSDQDLLSQIDLTGMSFILYIYILYLTRMPFNPDISDQNGFLSDISGQNDVYPINILPECLLPQICKTRFPDDSPGHIIFYPRNSQIYFSR